MGPVFGKASDVSKGLLRDRYLESESMDEESRLFAIDHPDDALVYGAQKHVLTGFDGSTPLLTIDYASHGKTISNETMEAMQARLNEWKAKRKKSSEQYQLYVKEMAAQPDRPDIARLKTVDQKTVLGTPIPAGSTVLG